MSIYEQISTIVYILVLMSIPLALFSLKKYIENLISEEKAEIKTDLEAWLNSDKGKQAIYQIGLLLGNAIKTGAGFGGRSGGGKFKFEDLIAFGAAKLFGLKLPGVGEGEEQPERAERQEKLPKM